MNLQAELISIGNELLSGQTLNTHGKDLGKALSALGLRLSRDTTIPDDLSIIGRVVEEALHRVHLIFISGGLGPTVDDITRDALARLLDQKIALHQPTVAHLKAGYEQRGRTINEAALRQALVLEHATALFNSAGAAPGQRLELDDGKTLFVLPGPPNEFNAILHEEIIPWLQVRYADIKPDYVCYVRTQGIGESDIVTLLDHANFHPADIELGFYPGQGRVQIRLSAPAKNKAFVQEAEHTLQHLLRGHLDRSE
ncbi:MAG: molybdopterin-binding protein [Pontiella sp.]